MSGTLQFISIDDNKEQHHLDEALQLALMREKSIPGSASASYWLGRAYSQKGNEKEALKYYEKAFTLKPVKKKYRKAYMKSRRLNSKIADDDE